MRGKYTKEMLAQAVIDSLSIADVLRKVGVKPIGGNYKTVHSRIKEFNLDTSHFTGAGWNVGKRFQPFGKKYKLEDVLIENSPYKSTGSLKRRLLDEDMLKYECNCCKISTWQEKHIVLELNHINGINTDNRLLNLELLCPNCHSQTHNFRGRNMQKSAISERREVEYRKFRETLTENADGNPEPSLSNKEGAETLHGIPKPKKPRIPTKPHNCLHCNIEFKRNRKFCSVECYREATRNTIPKVPEILEAFEVYKSYWYVGKYFGVSDVAVKKWCKSYGIIDMVKRKSSARTD